MRTPYNILHSWRIVVGGLLLGVLLAGGNWSSARAQFEVKNMAIGDLAHQYSAVGNEPFPSGGYDFRWPEYMAGVQGWLTQTQWYGGLWIARKDYTDPDGKNWNVKTAHVGPRATGAEEFFPTEFTTVSRFEPPVVEVDGFESFNTIADNDEVDPDLPSERMIVAKGNSVVGISYERRVYAWSQEFHDDYHITEYTFTNTGNIDADEEIEVQDQTAKEVYFFRHRRPQGHRMLDVVGTELSYEGEPKDGDLRAVLQWPWQGGDSEQTLGVPLLNPHWGYPEADTLGRLSETHFAGTATLFASKSADRPETNDMTQPVTTLFTGCDDQLMAIGQSHKLENKMRQEYEQLKKGHETPHHADWVDPDGDFTTKGGNPATYAQEGPEAGGYCSDWAYGPYTLEPGESVTIVMAEAVSGLDVQEASIIGRKFKEKGADVEAPITYRGVTMGKNDWWYTSRDTLLATMAKAQKHYYAGMGSIPAPPKPPKTFTVTSGVDEIQLEWTTYSDASFDHWELFRTRGIMSGRPADNYQYNKIATLDASVRTYRDTDVARGVEYYYYLQALGTKADNDGFLTPNVALRSGRYYAQTWDPASLKRSPGDVTSAARVVPNPLNVTSDQSVRWPGQQNKIGFLDIPGQCTIRIYTETGELVKTIEHTDGSGDEFWNLKSEDLQLVVSGVYLVTINNHDPGPEEKEQIVRKLIVVR